MKLKPSVRYYLSSIKPAVIIFYVVTVCLSIVSLILSFTMTGDSIFGGISAASIIFLFVAGICSFHEEFRVFIQNGFSRNELWRSFLVSSLIISCVMSAIDLALLGVLSFPMKVDSLTMLITTQYIDSIALNAILVYFLQIVFYALALNIGYLIRLVYYRMNKFGVITVSVGVPVFLFIVRPILSVYYNWDPLFSNLFSLLGRSMNPEKFYGLPMVYIFFICLLIVIAFINNRLIKRAVIK